MWHLKKTIHILVEKAFTNNWFNVTHKLNISTSDLVELLQVATKSQLFQFDGRLYEQVVANALLCSTEEQLVQENKLTSFYKRYVDDKTSSVSDI